MVTSHLPSPPYVPGRVMLDELERLEITLGWTQKIANQSSETLQSESNEKKSSVLGAEIEDATLKPFLGCY